MADLRVVSDGEGSVHSETPIVPSPAIKAAARFELRIQDRRIRVLPQMRGGEVGWRLLLYIVEGADADGWTLEQRVVDFLGDFEAASRRWIDLLISDGVIVRNDARDRLCLSHHTLDDLERYYLDLICDTTGQSE